MNTIPNRPPSDLKIDSVAIARVSELQGKRDGLAVALKIARATCPGQPFDALWAEHERADTAFRNALDEFVKATQAMLTGSGASRHL